MNFSRCDLEELSFVGGTSQDLRFKVETIFHEQFNANDYTLWFAIINSSNKTGVPILKKTASFSQGSDSYFYATITLNSLDTVSLSGKFIYQITLVQNDNVGQSDPDHQGIMIIIPNINRSAILSQEDL